MADFARYLPLSQRARSDERGVTSDRRAPTATVLREVAGALRAGGAPGWGVPTEDGGTVATTVARLMAGFDRPPARRALDSAQRVLGMQAAQVAPAPAPSGAMDAAAALEARASLVSERPQPTRLIELDDAVVAAILVGDALGASPAVPPLASGAVALRRAAAAPTPIKAVISGHSLHATDAGWTIGHGPALVGTAHELIRFLAGIGTEAPRRAREGDVADD
ncbi:MAG: hypothetical protein K0S05_1134 [Agromyces sp.]|nr:hypothetical protein [Agromyces sp.]